MIYITLYGQTRFSKRGHSLAQLTQHMVYEALTQKEGKGQNFEGLLRISVAAAHNLCPSLFSVFTSLLLQQCPPKVFLGHKTPPSSFFFRLSSLSGHSAGSQLVQMSRQKTKRRRRRRVIDGKIITGRHYWRRRRKQMFY